MRDGLAAGDRVQLHINNGKKKAYIRNGLDWIKRFPVGRSAALCPGRVKSPSGRYCCKSRKSNNPKNLAKADLWTSLLLRRISTPRRRLVIVLDETVWSLTSPRVKRIGGSRNFRSSPQKDFCNKIGHWQTCGALRSLDQLRTRLSVDRRRPRRRPVAQGREMSNGCTFSPPAIRGFDGSKRSRTSRFLTSERATTKASFKLLACRSATLKKALPK
jgi:hypothetical protein